MKFLLIFTLLLEQITAYDELVFQEKIIDKKMTQQEAVNYCENLKEDAVEDWYLPNEVEILELSSSYNEVKLEHNISLYLREKYLSLMPKWRTIDDFTFWTSTVWKEKNLGMIMPLVHIRTDIEFGSVETKVNRSSKHHLLCTYKKELEDICYRFNGKDFNFETTVLEEPSNENNFSTEAIKDEDFIVNISPIKYDSEHPWMQIEFVNTIPYAGGNSFYCMKSENNQTGYYTCVGDCDGGRMSLNVLDNNVTLHIEYARMADNPDVPVMHHIHSQGRWFAQGVKHVCQP